MFLDIVYNCYVDYVGPYFAIVRLSFPINHQLLYRSICVIGPFTIAIKHTPTLNIFVWTHSPQSYRIDISRLKNTYKQLQRELHPDKFSIKSEVGQYMFRQQVFV